MILRPLFILIVMFSMQSMVVSAEDTHLVPSTAANVIASSKSNGAEYTVINLWATWCIPCRQEFPHFVKLHQELAAKGVNVTFLSCDFEESKKDAVAFLKEQGVTRTNYIKAERDEPFVQSFPKDWSGALPMTVIYDKQANLLTWWEGAVNHEELTAHVKKAMSVNSVTVKTEPAH